MRVLVDLLFYTGKKGGMESYVRHLYAQMPREDFEYIGFASSELMTMDASWFPGRLIDSGVSGENRAAWAWGELTAVARAARVNASDVIHCPANLGPWRSRVPVVLTVHDLLPLRHPEFVPGPYAPVLKILIRAATRTAGIILADSGQTATDLREILRIAEDRIEVVPLSGPPTQLTTSENDVIRESRLLLALGNRLPHKNFAALLRALALIPVESRPRLVITGSHGDDPLAPLVSSLGLDDFVELRGWLTDGEIHTLYARASATVVPTLFEGFGLPVLEAMTRGCPVICSDIPVLHEVAGDAALYFDPTSPQAIADAIRTALDSANLLAQLRDDGLARSREFSWKRTAQRTASALQRAAK